jgi:hypothetical protein
VAARNATFDDGAAWKGASEWRRASGQVHRPEAVDDIQPQRRRSLSQVEVANRAHNYRVAITPDCGLRDKTLARASNAGAQTFADSCGSDPPQ